MAVSWKDVVSTFVTHIDKMKKAAKTDFIMFTIKSERGAVFDKVKLWGSAKFKHVYHYAMTEAVEKIKAMGLDPAHFMKNFQLLHGPAGAPVRGYTVKNLNHKIVIVLNDYDGGMTTSWGSDVADIKI